MLLKVCSMLIEWYGQACIVLETISGFRMICDPYDDTLGYSLIKKIPDLVTVSHNSFDHNAVHFLQGKPVVIDEASDIKIGGVKIISFSDGLNSIPANTIFNFIIDNISVTHLGDVQKPLKDEVIAKIKPCDILCVPIGGLLTADGYRARKICSQINPKIIIPIHYSTPSNKLALDGSETFIKGFIEICRQNSWDGTRSNFPKFQTVYLLKALGELKNN